MFYGIATVSYWLPSCRLLDDHVTLSLLLLRHAKAADASPKDHGRALATRGMRDSKKIAQYLSASALKPDIVLCSTAKRARLTLDPILSIWPELPVSYEDGLYLASTADAIAHLRQVDQAQSVLMIGHNPTMEDLLRRLIDRQRPQDSTLLADALSKYPTGALAELSLDLDHWGMLDAPCGQLTRFIKPRTLEEPQ